MRLLAISWAMPPMLTPRSLQVSRLLKSLGRLGCPATVVAAEPAAPIPGIIEDAGLAELYHGSYTRVAVPYGSDAGALRTLLRKPPDPDTDWVARSVKAARRILSRAPHTHIVTFAQPWFDHLVGLQLRRRSGLPWVAHFSDPWVDSPYYDDVPPALRRRWEEEEAAVIDSCDAVVFTSSETAELVMRKYATSRQSKVFVVPHGFDPELTPERPPRRRDGRLRIVHTGDFYEGRRSPSGLLRAIAMLLQRPPWRDRLELVLVGAVPETYRHEAEALGLGAAITYLGRLALRETSAAAATADVLVSIDAPAERSVFLPSKLIDYLAFEKPILGLTPAEGAAARLLRALGCRVAPPDEPECIADVLAITLDGAARGEGVGDDFRRIAAEYDIGKVARRHHDVLAGVGSFAKPAAATRRR